MEPKGTQLPAVPSSGPSRPLITVIVLNYNGAKWLKRCLESIRVQAVFERLEVIVADNASPDKSDVLAEELMHGWANGRVLRHGANLGFCEGNNRAALHASGEYLFFLNNDTWMEPDCLSELVTTVERMGAQAGEPLISDYDDSSNLCQLGAGFDIFGMMSLEHAAPVARPVFVVGGCSYLIKRDLFRKLGGFDPAFFMYVDEYDLSWRLWVSGAKAILVPTASLHHRGAANVNPKGQTRMVEFRTSDMKRFYTNRNGLLLLLKNCQHVLLLMVLFQGLLLICEALAALVLVRRWQFVKRAYLNAFTDCWRLRSHICAERKRIRHYRRRSDWRMLRFLRLRLNRWDEFLSLWKRGLPRVSAE